MKGPFAIAVATVITGAALTLTSFTGCSFFEMKQKEIVSSYLDSNGHTTSVNVDVSDGWSCEKSYGTVLIYDHDNTQNSNVTATARTVDINTYKSIERAARKDLFSQEVSNGVMYQTKKGDMEYVCVVGDSTYINITAKNTSPSYMKEIISRVTLSQVR